MDKALSYLSLARKAGRTELGEEAVGAAARAEKAPLIVVAADAADRTFRRAKSFTAGTQQQCLRLPVSKAELGQSVGRSELAIAAVTDAALALALVKALPEPQKYSGITEALETRVSRIRQREKEEKAHQRNRRTGKAHHAAQKKEH